MGLCNTVHIVLRHVALTQSSKLPTTQKLAAFLDFMFIMPCFVLAKSLVQITDQIVNILQTYGETQQTVRDSPLQTYTVWHCRM